MIVQGVELFTCGHSCHNLQQRIRDLPDFRFTPINYKYWLNMIPGGRIKINICSQQVLGAKYYLGVALKGARLFAAIFLPKGAKKDFRYNP